MGQQSLFTSCHDAFSDDFHESDGHEILGMMNENKVNIQYLLQY